MDCFKIRTSQLEFISDQADWKSEYHGLSKLDDKLSNVSF